MTSGADPNPPAPFARIVPQAPKLAAGAAPGPTARAATVEPGLRPRSVAIALAAILGLALLIFLMLPGPQIAPAPSASSPKAVDQPAPPATAAATGLPTSLGTSQSTSPALWDDPALLEARAAAQALQRQVDERVAELVSQGAERWAGAALVAAQRVAQSGASAFEQRDFEAARRAYQTAAGQLEALVQDGAAQLTQALTEGREALARADRPAAESAFARALLIDADNGEAGKGLARARQLDAVIAKLQTARRLEQIDDEAGAAAAYREALQLDPETLEARDALARIEAARGKREFRRLLGEAFEALDRGDLSRAGARIASARRLRASDPGLSQAQARLAEAGRSSRLAQLEAEATAQVQAENWAGAVKTYGSALEIDPATAYARDGLESAQRRAQLAATLDGHIHRADRLSASAVAAEAAAALAQARAVSGPGPRLQAQIAALDAAMAQAAQPVSLRLRSDSQTEVTIYRVGPQGRFAERELTLAPGRYVAVGTRAGYRDVRREFELSGGSPATLEIRCEEPL